MKRTDSPSPLCGWLRSCRSLALASIYAWTIAVPYAASARQPQTVAGPDHARAEPHQEQVRTHYERGRSHYANAEYKLAAREFQRALDFTAGLHAPKMRHALLANLALTHERRAESSEQPITHFRAARQLYQQLVEEESKLSPHACPAHASALAKLSELPKLDDPAPKPALEQPPAPSSSARQLERHLGLTTNKPGPAPRLPRSRSVIVLAATGGTTALLSAALMSVGLVQTRREIAYANRVVRKFAGLHPDHPDQELGRDWRAYRDSELPRIQTTWAIVGAAGMTVGIGLAVAAMIHGVRHRKNPNGPRSVQSNMQLGRASLGFGLRY